MKKKITYILLLISIFMINSSVSAINLFGDGEEKDVCGLSLSSNVPAFTSGIFNIIKILVPIILIIFGLIDFTKAVMAQDEKKMKDSTTIFIRRIVAAVFIFFIVAIVQFVFKKVTSENGFTSCMNCILNNKCDGVVESYRNKTLKSTCVKACDNIKDTAGNTSCINECKTHELNITCDTCEKLPTSEQTACKANCQTITVSVKDRSKSTYKDRSLPPVTIEDDTNSTDTSSNSNTSDNVDTSSTPDTSTNSNNTTGTASAQCLSKCNSLPSKETAAKANCEKSCKNQTKNTCNKCNNLNETSTRAACFRNCNPNAEPNTTKTTTKDLCSTRSVSNCTKSKDSNGKTFAVKNGKCTTK